MKNRASIPGGRSTGVSPPIFPPIEFYRDLRRLSPHPTRFMLAAAVRTQEMDLFERDPDPARYTLHPWYRFKKRYRISTSRFGIGQRDDSNQTPLGMHRIAVKIGAGSPIGTEFRSRIAAGFVWRGRPRAPIAHRILWLEGVDPQLNRKQGADSFSRYIYIHGVGDESTLGRPASRGCIHLSASDLIPLFDLAPAGTLVWIGR